MTVLRVNQLLCALCIVALVYLYVQALAEIETLHRNVDELGVEIAKRPVPKPRAPKAATS